MSNTAAKDRPTGLVLSGGGARGAYEVGVLQWIAHNRPDVLAGVRVASGASVGAINGAFLASRGFSPESVDELVDVWEGLRFEEVMRFSPGHIARMVAATGTRFARGGTSPPVGIFRGRALSKLITRTIAWHELHRHIRRGRVDAVAVAATDIGSGRTHLFVEHSDRIPTPRWPHDRSMVAQTTALKPSHVLASCAIPFIFSPVQVGDYWYTDGGVRQNTPLSPALRLGAKRLLVVSLGAPDERVDTPGVFPGLGQLLGKLFNSLFLDRMMWDLDRLDRINDVILAGLATYGDDFLSRIHVELKQRGRRPYQPIPYVAISPSADIGVIAARVLREPGLLHTPLNRPMAAILASDNMSAADAASYLLFDGGFCRELIQLGRADAAANAHQFDVLTT